MHWLILFIFIFLHRILSLFIKWDIFLFCWILYESLYTNHFIEIASKLRFWYPHQLSLDFSASHWCCQQFSLQKNLLKFLIWMSRPLNPSKHFCCCMSFLLNAFNGPGVQMLSNIQNPVFGSENMSKRKLVVHWILHKHSKKHLHSFLTLILFRIN